MPQGSRHVALPCIADVTRAKYNMRDIHSAISQRYSSSRVFVRPAKDLRRKSHFSIVNRFPCRSALLLVFFPFNRSDFFLHPSCLLQNPTVDTLRLDSGLRALQDHRRSLDILGQQYRGFQWGYTLVHGESIRCQRCVRVLMIASACHSHRPSLLGSQYCLDGAIVLGCVLTRMMSAALLIIVIRVITLEILCTSSRFATGPEGICVTRCCAV